MLRTTDAGGPGITPAGTPATYALNAVSVRRGAKATFRFRVIDPGVPREQIKVQILDAGKRVKATFGAGWRPTEQVVVFSGKVSLKPGRYTWRAVCVDYTGAAQSSASAKPLVVK